MAASESTRCASGPNAEASTTNTAISDRNYNVHDTSNPSCPRNIGSDSDSDLPTIIYTPLARNNSEIRMLNIIPGTFEDDIKIDLSTMSFNPYAKDRYPYEALSYTWGTADNPATISVHYEDRWWRLPVTRNCEEALRHLRCKEDAKAVWIDAICINQRDLDERERQVLVMRFIYSKASIVRVWLGPASDDSGLAIEWIDSVSREVVPDDNTSQLVPLLADCERLSSREVIASDEELEALANLLERPYFERLWVWQEISMGKDYATLGCGHHTTSFKNLLTALYYCNSRTWYGRNAQWRVLPRTKYILEIPLTAQRDQLDSLDRLRRCKCHDQRDRIYTCLAFGAMWNWRIDADYKRPTREIYNDFILSYMQETKDLRLLEFVGDISLHEAEGEVVQNPSWVPDWSKPKTAHRFVGNFCSGTSGASVISADDVHLAVEGIHVGTVKEYADFGSTLLSNVSVEDWHSALYRTLHAILPNGITEDISYRLARLLTADHYAEHYEPPRNDEVQTLTQCEHYITHVLSDRMEDYVAERDALGPFAPCLGRTLFLTNDGRIGLGPQGMRADDVLAVILGCKNIIILRPSDGITGQYNVIGNALCTGLMDGEALLGPLPEELERVLVSVPSTRSSLPAFRNRQSGTVIYEDPRLPPMGPEWKDISEQSPGNSMIWQNQNTSEIRGFFEDPRLDAVSLEDRGVELEIFTLV